MRFKLKKSAVVAVVVIVIVGVYLWRRTEPFADESKLCGGVYFREFPGFLTPTECDALVAAAEARGLEPSQVGGVDDGRLDLSARRSDQTWFAPGEHASTDAIRRKTENLLASTGCVRGYGLESIQVARYGPGGKYDTHYDGDDCAAGACPADQRIATLMVYLARPEAGGDTSFPLLGKRVTPEKGKALFFWVADPGTRELFEKTLHAGAPVRSGVKWIANQWVRAE